MPKQLPFSQVIQALLDDSKPFPSRHLKRFSDLENDDLRSVLDVWPELTLPRKLALLVDLENLAEVDTLMSFENLGRALLKDTDPEIRIRAIGLLWECADAKLIPLYLDILHNDVDHNARAASASVLRQFIYQGELEKIPPELLHTIEDALLNAVNSGETDLIRRRALEALGTSSHNKVPILIESAYHRKETDWIASALFAMGYSSDKRWEKYILAHLRDTKLVIRSEAIRAAGRLGLVSARIPLLDLLEDNEDPEARNDIIWALSGIGGEGVREKFDELLDLETDADELNFLDDALENLLFTEDLSEFGLLDFDTNQEDEENHL